MAFGQSYFGRPPQPLSQPTASNPAMRGLANTGAQRGATGGGMFGQSGRQEMVHRQQTDALHQPRMNAAGDWVHNTTQRPAYYFNGKPVGGGTVNTFVQEPNADNLAWANRGPGAGGGGANPGGPMGGLIAEQPMPAPVAPIGNIDDSEAVREAYARAKDTAGQQGRAALDALMDVQGARGIVGSGIGINEAGGVIGEGARQLGDFNREQAIQRVENERWRQGTNYQGNINQRGQTMNWQNMEQGRRRYNADNSPYGHVQGAGVNPVPMPYPRY